MHILKAPDDTIRIAELTWQSIGTVAILLRQR